MRRAAALPHRLPVPRHRGETPTRRERGLPNPLSSFRRRRAVTTRYLCRGCRGRPPPEKTWSAENQPATPQTRRPPPPPRTLPSHPPPHTTRPPPPPRPASTH